MNQELLNQMQANMQSAQHAFVWVWFVLIAINLVLIAIGAYWVYWTIQLVKAATRALDRWNPGQVARQSEQGPATRERPPGVSEELKYGPKAR